MGLAEDSISPNLMLHWFISPLTCPFLRMYPIFRHIQRGHQVSSFFSQIFMLVSSTCLCFFWSSLSLVKSSFLPVKSAFFVVKSLGSSDRLTGNFTGFPHISWENPWFPVKIFPTNPHPMIQDGPPNVM